MDKIEIYMCMEDFALLKHIEADIRDSLQGVVEPIFKVYSDKENFLSAIGAMNKQFRVEIIADSLHIRRGPGTSYPVEGYVHKNEIYTITDERNGFGKLLSGVGWISLSNKYVRRHP